MNYLYEDETYKIIGAAQEVHKELGSGFLEMVYQDALEIEFKNRKIPYHREYPILIHYKETKLDRVYRSDFFCFVKIVVEIKAIKSLTDEFYGQTMHYLSQSDPFGKSYKKRTWFINQFWRSKPKSKKSNLDGKI